MAMYVVDQNVMRHPTLRERIISESDAIFVVPDIALVEMAKNEEWESTMRQSFAVFDGNIRRVVLCLAMGEVLRSELEGRNSINCERLIAWDYCGSLQGLIISLARGSDTPVLVEMRDKMVERRAEFVEESANPDATKDRVLHIVDTWKNGLRPQVIADLRNGFLSGGALLGYIKLSGDEYFEQMMVQEGIPEPEIESFRRSKPMVLRYFYLLIRHSLCWVARNGLSTMRPERVLNHMIDQEYVALASFFDGFLSSDKEAQAAHSDLCVLLDDTSMEKHECSACDYLRTLT